MKLKDDPLITVALVVIVLCVLTFLCRNCLSSSQSVPAPPAVPIESTIDRASVDAAEKKRRDFAFGMEVSSKESSATIRNIRYTTEGVSSKTLVLTADGVSPNDCETLAKSTYGQGAASLGFTILKCRNRVSSGEWSLFLSN